MKLFIILSFALFLQLCSGDLNARDSSRICYECERQNLELAAEVEELRKANGELNGQINKLKQLLTLQSRRRNNVIKRREKRDAFTATFDFNTMKCSIEAEEVPACEPKKLSALKFVDQMLCQKVCHAKNSNGEWTVIQRRIDGSENFYRGWADYKIGFGTITGEFFIGLDSLHLLTTCTSQELLIEMEDHENQKRSAKYALFAIGDESEKYVMKELGNYTGDAGDSLSYHRSRKFSTFDQDNDDWTGGDCAKYCKGAWWYGNCLESNLNGEYGNTNKGINWFYWHGYYYSLKKVEMKIRPWNSSFSPFF